MAEFTLKPIGIFKGTHKNKASVPRQGALSQQHGVIEFENGFDSKLAMRGLEKMSHLWLIFSFHKAESKPKPLVRPPRNPDIQVGVWATRSPYRPNSLGLTLAKIESVEGKKLFLSQVDLLDGTPIFDIKPYVTESDFVKKPSLGWIDEIENWKYSLSPEAQTQALFLKENGLLEIDDVIESQFGTKPLQPKRKRIKTNGKNYILAYRTWRFLFKVSIAKKHSQILKIFSGYSDDELKDSMDPYQDKTLHREFIK